MTKREKTFAISGSVILAVALAASIAWPRYAVAEWTESEVGRSGYSHVSRVPDVVLGGDSKFARYENAIRVDVRNGIPHTRDSDGAPITDLVGYINAEAIKTGAEKVVVSAAKEERIGDVIAIIDECRKARIKTVILNQFLDAFSAT